jgi:ABC-2 type transport system ATP-binding protein
MNVEVKNITKIYGEQKAVNNVSFILKKGEIVGFIGPNGAGKSTTMKSICGIVTPDSGDVFVNHKNVQEALIETKRSIGYLPESNPLYFDQYIEEYLLYVGKMYKIKNLEHRIAEVIKLTGLEPERKKLIGQLSKGYKQRVGIAQALLHDPEILILDEPTTGLDPNQLLEIRKLIQNIGKAKAVLLSTHILQEVEAICDRVIMINQGKIVADQATEIAKQGVAETQTIRVEFKKVPDQNALTKIQGVLNIQKESDTVYFIESALEDDLREKVFQYAMDKGISILEMQTIKRSLEDAFRELSGN